MSNESKGSANGELQFVSNLNDTELELIASGKVKKIVQVPYRQDLIEELKEKDAPFKHLSKVFRFYHLAFGMGITRPAASFDEMFAVLYPEDTETDSDGNKVAKEGKKYKIYRLAHDVNHWWHNSDATFYYVENKNKKASTDEVIVVEHVVSRLVGKLKIGPKSRLRKLAESMLKAEARIEERSNVSVEHIKNKEVKFIKQAELEVQASAIHNEEVRLRQALAILSTRKTDVKQQRDVLWREDE